MPKPSPPAYLIAPDPALRRAYEALIRCLSVSAADPRSLQQLSCGCATVEQLMQHQEAQLRARPSTPANTAWPLWLRSAQSGDLLGLALLQGCGASLRLLYLLTDQFSGQDDKAAALLLPILAEKAPIWQTDRLRIASVQPNDGLWPERFRWNETEIHAKRQGDEILLSFHSAGNDRNLYRNSAEFYERDLPDEINADIPFYLHQAAELKAKRILDLACGSGRILLPLVEAGYSVVGLDHAEAMLQVLRRRLQLLPAALRRQARIHQADIAAFSLDQDFDLALIPFRSLQMLPGPAAVLQCLRTIRRHLRPPGYLLFAVVNPDAIDLASLLMPETTIWQEKDPVDGILLSKKTWCDEVDLQQQWIRQGVVWETLSPRGNFRRCEDLLHYYYYTHEQIRELLAEAGFSPITCWGGFRGEALGHGEEQVILARCLDALPS